LHAILLQQDDEKKLIIINSGIATSTMITGRTGEKVECFGQFGLSSHAIPKKQSKMENYMFSFINL